MIDTNDKKNKIVSVVFFSLHFLFLIIELFFQAVYGHLGVFFLCTIIIEEIAAIMFFIAVLGKFSEKAMQTILYIAFGLLAVLSVCFLIRANYYYKDPTYIIAAQYIIAAVILLLCSGFSVYSVIRRLENKAIPAKAVVCLAEVFLCMLSVSVSTPFFAAGLIYFIFNLKFEKRITKKDIEALREQYEAGELTEETYHKLLQRMLEKL